MYVVEEAFRAGLDLVRRAGIPAKGNDVAVLAAYSVFEKHSAGKEADPRYPEQGPIHAQRLILEAYARGGPS